jgi:hypothetical protein
MRNKLPADLKKPDNPKVFGAPYQPPRPEGYVDPNGNDGQSLPPLATSRDGQVIRKTQPAVLVVEEEPGEDVSPPTPKKYRVTKGGPFYNSGAVANMRPGKVISDVEYNVESLKQQGIEMTELT